MSCLYGFCLYISVLTIICKVLLFFFGDMFYLTAVVRSIFVYRFEHPLENEMAHLKGLFLHNKINVKHDDLNSFS